MAQLSLVEQILGDAKTTGDAVKAYSELQTAMQLLANYKQCVQDGTSPGF